MDADASADVVPYSADQPSVSGSETFSVLANHVCTFVDAWEARQSPPPIADFLPADAALREIVLVELIKTDLEYRWVQYNLPKRLQDYQLEFPELSRRGLTTDLIYEEFLVRRASGLAVEAREYLDEFPEHAASLQQLLGLSEDRSSTVLVKREQVAALEAIAPGDVIDDFELLVALGRGAFAKVFLARQKSMQRLVAVKISPDSGTEPQTLAQLDHDAIVRVFDQRVLSDRRLRLLYMQYIPGGTLHSVVERVRATEPSERNGTLLLDVVDAALEQRGEIRPSDSPVRKKFARYTWPEAVAALGARLADALAYAHRRGVLHRDVKPANVLLTADGEPKLADFNISFSDHVTGATPAAYFGGSLAYMSPEQLEAFHPENARQPEDLDGRSDAYGLGVVLCELLTGSRPFTDEEASADWHGLIDRMIATRRSSDRAVTQKLAARGAPTPADCPPTLRRVLDRCLAPHPEQRWRSAEELSQQLAVCLDPAARRLIDPADSAESRRQIRFAAPLLILLVLIPSALAGIYNYSYNLGMLNREPNREQLLPVFERVQMIVNAIAFPLGIGIGLWMTVRAARVVQGLLGGRIKPEDCTAAQRMHCLGLGEQAAMICLTLWVVAGLAYPVALHVAVGQIPPRVYATFIGSLTICGLIATAYPFFLVSHFCVRRLYPVFVQAAVCGEKDAVELKRLSQRLPLYFGAATAVPLLAIIGLLLSAFGGQPFQAATMFAVCVGGIVGLACTYWLYRRLESDLAALHRVVGRHE